MACELTECRLLSAACVFFVYEILGEIAKRIGPDSSRHFQGGNLLWPLGEVDVNAIELGPKMVQSEPSQAAKSYHCLHTSIDFLGI